MKRRNVCVCFSALSFALFRWTSTSGTKRWQRPVEILLRHIYDIDVQAGGETGVLHFDVACSITLILGWCLKRGQGDGNEWTIMKNVLGALRATAARRHPGTLREQTWTLLEQVVAKLLAYKDGLKGTKEQITDGGELFALARKAADTSGSMRRWSCFSLRGAR